MKDKKQTRKKTIGDVLDEKLPINVFDPEDVMRLGWTEKTMEPGHHFILFFLVAHFDM